MNTVPANVEARLASRASLAALRYPQELPVSQRRDDLLATIRDHQVVIVAGETGSGKTTQLPKICVELGRGTDGMIGHTQPRRIAARTVAERIAEELGVPLGGAVGYQVRFTGRVGDGTLVKLMTDGILLAEIQRDRLLRRYDTLIIDEAHERSLNVDFILGYIKQILPRRPDLKVIITSATIDPHRFARHFGEAPVVEVSGRTYPVEVRYRPVIDPDDPASDPDRDQIQAISDAVDELRGEAPGDILVFLSGEREIRDTADTLARRNLPDTEILPLYARLSTAEQHRVFQSHRGRRIVLATNVAETSLTVPGIRYVIDTGTARISRYSQRTKVQRLPIEAISQASANQRKGRCGRLSDGICVRLYSQDDFLGRPEFTEPEILRTNLASVILQMTAIGLGDIPTFPFLDPPDRRQIADGVALLRELGAFRDEATAAKREEGGSAVRRDAGGKLTPIGRKLAQLPIDPRFGRMVLEADRTGCLREVLVIAAGLSIQDPRERPVDRQPAATEKHSRFADETSDFMAYLNLWNYLREKQRELSSNQFRRMCRTEFLHYLRIREWQDLYSQLRQIAATLGMAQNSTPAPAQQVHTALLAGLLSHIGLKDQETREYLGARGAKLAIFPGSGLYKKQPRWMMAAELVETSRLWARIVAKVEPEWVEPLAGHLVKRSYSEPHWEKKPAAVIAYEKVTLYGVPIVARRAVNYGRIDPALARELFIRHALVEGDWDTHHEFFHANRDLLVELEDLEHRARRRDIVVDDETVFAFYDARLPDDVVSGRHFDAWWKKARRATADLLTLTVAMLVTEAAGGVNAADYPDTWDQGGLGLALRYQFEPGTDADGVTVHIPIPLLGQVSPEGFDWQVPGLREDLVTALLRGLPKPIRRNFVPVPDHVKAVLHGVSAKDGPLIESVAAELRRLTGVAVPRDAWRLDSVPDHLRMTFRILADDGSTVREGKDLAALKRELAPAARAAVSEVVTGSVTDPIERTGLRAWTVGTLPRVIERSRGGYVVRGYPSLVDDGDSVAVRLLETEAGQVAGMSSGTRRLLALTIASPATVVSSQLSLQEKLALSRNPHGNVAALIGDCVGAAIDRLVGEAGGPVFDEDGFARLREHVRAGLPVATLDTVRMVGRILGAAHTVEAGLSVAPEPSRSDLRDQLGALVYSGFVTATGWRRLPDLVRYLTAMSRRLDKLPENPARDWDRAAEIAEVRDECRDILRALPVDRREAAAAHEIRWMIEELRVSLFAQQLGTPYPISATRIYRALDAL